MRFAFSFLILLAGCQSVALPVDRPATAKNLVVNAIAIYQQDGLLRSGFYSNENLKRLSGANAVEHTQLTTPHDSDWREKIEMSDFSRIEAPTKVWRPDLSSIRFVAVRAVKGERVISASLQLEFRSNYASARRSLITRLLESSCREDKDEEIARFMSITREVFNPPLGKKSPVIISCVAKGKKMIMDFGLAEPGADPTLETIEIVEKAD